MTRPSTCVIYNPAAGRGRAARQIAASAAGWPEPLTLLPTAGPGDAVRLARRACDDGFARVVAAGGDGTVHEVANGVLESGRSDVIFATWPLGSMNDYAYTLGVGAWWAGPRRPGDLVAVPADVGRVTVQGRSHYFINGCGIGFNGLVSNEARGIRWLRGVPLYSLAVLKGLAKHFSAPHIRLILDGVPHAGPLLAFSLGIGQREGGFPLTPVARIDDGLFDLLRVGDIRRWELVRHFPGMITGRLPLTHPKITIGRSRVVEILSESPLCVHADGEILALPADGVREIRVEMLPARLRVETYPPAMYAGTRFADLVPVYDSRVRPSHPQD